MMRALPSACVVLVTVWCVFYTADNMVQRNLGSQDRGGSFEKTELTSKLVETRLDASRYLHAAAQDCSSDPSCAPSMKELVNRAAMLCGKEASCTCNFVKNPRKCFLEEIQRHPRLMRDATALEEEVHEREQLKKSQEALRAKEDVEDRKFKRFISRGRQDLHWQDLIAAEVASALCLHSRTAVHSTNSGDAATRWI